MRSGEEGASQVIDVGKEYNNRNAYVSSLICAINVISFQSQNVRIS